MPRKVSVGGCCRCLREFPETELYWHNYVIIGYFCRWCFDFIARHSGSIEKHGSLAEVRKNMILKEEQDAKDGIDGNDD
jgi:hypothetical protein